MVRKALEHNQSVGIRYKLKRRLLIMTVQMSLRAQQVVSDRAIAHPCHDAILIICVSALCKVRTREVQISFSPQHRAYKDVVCSRPVNYRVSPEE